MSPFEIFSRDESSTDTETGRKGEVAEKSDKQVEQKNKKESPETSLDDRIQGKEKEAEVRMAALNKKLEDREAQRRVAEEKAKSVNQNADMFAELATDAVIPGGVMVNQEQTKTNRVASADVTALASAAPATEVADKTQVQQKEKKAAVAESPAQTAAQASQKQDGTA